MAVSGTASSGRPASCCYQSQEFCPAGCGRFARSPPGFSAATAAPTRDTAVLVVPAVRRIPWPTRTSGGGDAEEPVHLHIATAITGTASHRDGYRLGEAGLSAPGSHTVTTAGLDAS